MYKKYALTFLAIIIASLIIASLLLSLTTFDKSQAFIDYYARPKVCAVEAYIEAMFNNMRDFHSVSIATPGLSEAINRRDEIWLDNHVVRSTIDEHLFGINAIAIGDAATGDHWQWSDKGAVDLMANEAIVQAVLSRRQETRVIALGDVYYFIVIQPIAKAVSSGDSMPYILAANRFDDQTKDEMIRGLASKSAVTLTIVNGRQDAIKMKNNRLIVITQPIGKTTKSLIATYGIQDDIDQFMGQRNRMIVLVLLAVLFAYGHIVLVMRKVGGRVTEITAVADRIAHGDVNVRIDTKRYRAVPQLKRMADALSAMQSQLSEQRSAIEDNYSELINMFTRAIDIIDPHAIHHNDNVARYATILAEALDYSNVEQLRLAAHIHDIGKIDIGFNILNKTSPLTPDEWTVVKEHPRVAYDCIKTVSHFDGVKEAVLHHHENWDGSGYPSGLREDQIPFMAQLLAIADVYDALTSDRSYRRAMSHAQAMTIILENSGKKFNPHIVEAFKRRADQIGQVMKQSK